MVKYLTGEIHSYKNSISQIVCENSVYTSSIDNANVLNDHVLSVVGVDTRKMEIFGDNKYNEVFGIYSEAASMFLTLVLSDEVVKIIKSANKESAGQLVHYVSCNLDL